MTDQERARALAADWKRGRSGLEGLEPHVVPYRGYWWASFRPPGAEHPNVGGVSLLIDLARGTVTVASASKPPDSRIADYEATIGTAD